METRNNEWTCNFLIQCWKDTDILFQQRHKSPNVNLCNPRIMVNRLSEFCLAIINTGTVKADRNRVVYIYVGFKSQYFEIFPNNGTLMFKVMCIFCSKCKILFFFWHTYTKKVISSIFFSPRKSNFSKMQQKKVTRNRKTK